MLRSVFRRSMAARTAMQRTNMLDKLHPFMMKLRESLEEVQEFIDKGEPLPYEETVPLVFEEPVSELDALSHAIPETPYEYEWLIDRWESLVNDVERTRLQYFDHVYGTRTFYQPSMVGQERISIDTIHDKRITPNKWSRLTQYESIKGTREQLMKPVLMRKDVDEEFNQNYLFTDRLKQINATVYDPCGRAYRDIYHYLRPTAMEQEDMGVIISYMEVENDRYYTNIHLGKNTISKAVIDGAIERLTHTEFVECLPATSSTSLYMYSKEAESIVRIKFSDLEKFNSKVQPQNSSAENSYFSLSTNLARSAERHNSLLSDTKLHETVISLRSLRDYFLSFDDQVSYDVVKYLQFNDLPSSSLHRISVDGDRLMAVDILIADACFTVVVDIGSRRVLSQYFVSPIGGACLLAMKKIYRVESKGREQTLKVLDLSKAEGLDERRKGHDEKNASQGDGKSDKEKKDEENEEDGFVNSDEDPAEKKKSKKSPLRFIDVKYTLDNINSVVGHMNSENLEPNIDHSYSLVTMHGRNLTMIKDRHKVDLLCFGETSRPDRYSVIDDKVTAVNSTLTSIEGFTDSMKYTVGIDAKGFYVSRSKQTGAGSTQDSYEGSFKASQSSGEKHASEGQLLRLPADFEIKQVVFLARFMAIVLAGKDKNTDKIVYIDDSEPKLTLQTAQLSVEEGKIPSTRKIKLCNSAHSEGDMLVYIESTPESTRKLKMYDLGKHSVTNLVSEKVADRFDSVSEKYIETDSFTSTFVFAPKKTKKNSPILVWISSDENADLYSPIWDAFFEKEVILLVVKLKRGSEKNLKKTIDDIYTLCGKIAMDSLAETYMLYAEGRTAGLAGLAAHIRNLGIFESAVFKDPITDLLDLISDNKSSDFGYGNLKEEENCDRMLEDSPYHSDVLHHMRHVLFMSTNHEEGYHSLKFFANLKHFSTVTSEVYFTSMVQDSIAPLTAFSFLWRSHCKLQRESDMAAKSNQH